MFYMETDLWQSKIERLMSKLKIEIEIENYDVQRRNFDVKSKNEIHILAWWINYDIEKPRFDVKTKN